MLPHLSLRKEIAFLQIALVDLAVVLVVKEKKAAPRGKE